MTNTNPKKRKPSRPPKQKEKQKRQRRERIIPPPDAVWFDKKMAAGHFGLSISTIEKRFGHVFISVGDRRLAHRDKLDAEMLKREDKPAAAAGRKAKTESVSEALR
jgi:hypothetical protein